MSLKLKTMSHGVLTAQGFRTVPIVECAQLRFMNMNERRRSDSV